MSQATNYDEAVGIRVPGGTNDPHILFRQWYEEAESGEPTDPNAMSLATADASGLPDVRIVLLKRFDSLGFVFYTNSESQKGRALAANMNGAGVIHWKSLGRQVRFRGPVEFVSDDEADCYFRSRHKNSRIGAWASKQSQPLDSRATLEQAVAQAARQFGSADIPRPPYWRGYRIRPLYIEFWAGRPYRLHDRLVFTRPNVDAQWVTGWLYP